MSWNPGKKETKVRKINLRVRRSGLSSNLESLETEQKEQKEQKGQGQAVKLSMYPGNLDNMKERSGQAASIVSY
jgi:hypothetical protein